MVALSHRDEWQILIEVALDYSDKGFRACGEDLPKMREGLTGVRWPHL